MSLITAVKYGHGLASPPAKGESIRGAFDYRPVRRPRVLVGFGRRVMYGTNPLAFAAPADEKRAFALDMSTTVVTSST